MPRPSTRRAPRSRSALVLASCLGLLPAVTAQAPDPRSGDDAEPAAAEAIDATALGRKHTAWFFAGRSDALWEVTGPDMRAVFGGDPGVLVTFKDQVVWQFGLEEELLDETVQAMGGGQVYVRTADFEKGDGPLEILISYDQAGIIIGFLIRPKPVEAESRYLEYQTRTPLRLPFEGEWYVFWGGRTLAQNYHTATVDQRFAYDILVMVDGRSHTGDGSRNEQYHAFGRPVLAPGAGKVVSAAKDIPDNLPGEMNPAQALGNHVILDHGNGEFSFLAHIQQGTLRVELGDDVEAGQLLGLCGNSGNTTEAHIHYHLQTTAVFNGGEGLPTQFLDYEVVGEPIGKVARGEPVQGQVVRNGERSAPVRR